MTDPLVFAEGLCVQPTVPLIEDLPISYVLDFAKDRPSLSATQDAAGNVVLTYDGGSGPSAPLVLVAHLDHPGFVVAGDDDPVELEFRGGLLAENASVGTPLRFFRRGDSDATGTGHLVEVSDNGGRLTGGRASIDDGEVDHSSGFAVWDVPALDIADGVITARACDDLLGAAAILATLDAIAEAAPPDVHVIGLFTRAEEIGFLGALEAIRLASVPIEAAVLSLECSKALPHAPQGGGVIVRVGDRMSVFSPSLTAALGAAASQVAAHDAGFAWQRQLMDGGACEATAFCASGYRASGLALPLGNYHNAADDGPGIAAENVRVEDYLSEICLLTELATTPSLLDPETVEPPAWLTERAAAAQAALGAGAG